MKYKKFYSMKSFPCELMNPTTRGILDKWQGESRIDKTPHPKEASKAIQ